MHNVNITYCDPSWDANVTFTVIVIGLLFSSCLFGNILRGLRYFFAPLGRAKRRMKQDPVPVSRTSANPFFERKDNTVGWIKLVNSV